MSERINTASRIYIRPCQMEGRPLKVRKPVGGHLAASGEAVNDESYWQRRIADGDVELCDPPKAGATKAGK